MDQVPEGAIPEEEFVAKGPPQAIPEGAIPEEDFNQQQYGTPSEQFGGYAEQALSGATLGASQVAETKLSHAFNIPELSPEAQAGRAAANPLGSTVANVVGTAGLIGLTGGLGGLAEGAGTAAKIGVQALEGAGVAGITTANDEWSQDKALDAQKIAASAGLGTLLGAGGGALGEGIKSLSKIKPLAEVSSEVSDQAAKAGEDLIENTSAPVALPAGVKATNFNEIVDAVEQAKKDGTAVPLPAQPVLSDALSRTEMKFPVNPLQYDSLGSQEARSSYLTYKEAPKIGEPLSNYERYQKADLVNQIGKQIEGLAPGVSLTENAADAGEKAVSNFTDQYQNEKEALKPIFEEIKKLPLETDPLPDAITNMTKAVPGIAGMFDASGAEIAVKPYKTSWGIDRSTYNAVKEAVDSLQEPNANLQTIWNVRKGLDQHVDVLAQGQAPQEIRALKAALMEQMQNSTGNPNIREAFKRYAINEQQRQVIEQAFGASVGTPEFGQISKVQPEKILDKIFSNTATTEAAKNILPPSQFNEMLGNYFKINQSKVTDNGAFSSNKFWNKFLAPKQYVLESALSDNPEVLQGLKDKTTIARILPDDYSNNPPRTATTLQRLKEVFGEPGKVHITIPKAIYDEVQGHIKKNQLNTLLSGQALQNSRQTSLINQVKNVTGKVDTGVKALFSGFAGQSGKSNEK